jgi:twitching motility protein PilT
MTPPEQQPLSKPQSVVAQTSSAAATAAAAQFMEFDIEKMLLVAMAQNVSDIHIRIGSPPMFRLGSDIVATKFPVVTPESMRHIAQQLIPERFKAKLKDSQDIDFGLTWQNQRLRVNLLYELGRIAFVIRLVTPKIPTLKSLQLPPVVQHFTELTSGLVLVAGPTGSGKSTTLASMIEEINQTSARHIITLEDPVEYVYRPKKSLITQRQLEIDTESFSLGIRQSLRQNPDVLLIGELRDRQTAINAMKAAETGVLVFSTLHTPDAVQTINRVIHLFEPAERESVRHHLATVLKGVLSQRLYTSLQGAGRAAVCEVITVNSTVQDYMVRNDIDTLYRLVDQSRMDDMQSLNSALYQLYAAKRISQEEAIRLSNNPNGLRNRMQGIYHGTSAMEFTDF